VNAVNAALPSPRGRGEFRTRTWTANGPGASGRTYVTLQYMAAPDHPGYGVWEDVTTFISLDAAHEFIENPPSWWTNPNSDEVPDA